jgi:hypothetical protein
MRSLALPHRAGLAGLLALALMSDARAQGPVPEGAAVAEAPADDHARLQYDFLLLSTARWQLDNGNRTQPGDQRYDPTGENFGDLVTTIGGSVTYRELIAAVRFDTALFLRPPVAGPGASTLIQRELTNRYQDLFRLEYLSATYADKDVELTLGDYYVTLGRGMVLAIRKVGDLGIDNKLRGAEGKARLGAASVQGFAGLLNIKNVEQGTGFAYREAGDLVAGGRVEVSGGRFAKVGAHAALVRAPTDDDFRSEVRGYGVTLELPRPVKWASFYGEVALLERKQREDDQATGEEGKGAYGNLNLYFGPATFLIEGKAYDNLFNVLPRALPRSGEPGDLVDWERMSINRLTEPPTAERPLTLLLSNQTVRGGRVRFDYAVTPRFVPYLSLGRYRDTRTVASDITAAFGGARLRWHGGEAMGESGYRGQFVDDPGNPADGTLVRSDTHLLADVSQKLFGPYSLEVFFSGLRVGQEKFHWFEGRASLALRSTARWSAFVAYEFYTAAPAVYDPHYISAGGQWEFLPGSFLRALYGGERAGLKCVGGVCRFFPGFEGGRLELAMQL